MKQQARLSEYIHLIPLYGDIPVIMGFLKGQFWIKLFKSGDDPGAFLSILSRIVLFFMTMYAFSIRVFFRYRQGRLTIGWILTIFTLALLVMYNQPERPITAPILVLWLPFHELLYRGEDAWLPGMLFSHDSLTMWWMTVAFAALAVIHIVISYLPFGGSGADMFKRGVPVFWALSSLVFRKLKGTKDSMLWWLLEAGLVFGIGFYIKHTAGDFLFGHFLMSAAVCHGLLEAYEYFGLGRYISR